MHVHAIIPDIYVHRENYRTFLRKIIKDFPAVWNYGKLSAKFIISRIKDIDTVGVLSFSFQVLLEQLLKFLLNSLPSLLTSPRDSQSQLRIQKLIGPLLL